ncbi:MAG: hypothetical protein CM15mV126_050 [uncultured marine virus]|nr:MAG: hypothetical protein CM15mV126_050 [uncultured marine virus]
MQVLSLYERGGMVVTHKPLSQSTTKEENEKTKKTNLFRELHKLVGSKIFSAKFTKKDGSIELSTVCLV